MPQLSPRSECLLQLIIAQLAALLQLTQLWTVLGALTPAVDPAANVADAANVTEDDSSQRVLAGDLSVAPDKFLDNSSVSVLVLRPIALAWCRPVFRSSDV